MSELDKLEEYLKDHGFRYERIENGSSLFGFDRHQIIVYDEYGNNQWDVICQQGSYGYGQGLLEACGDPIVNRKKDGDTVAGYLTSADVIYRLENGNG